MAKEPERKYLVASSDLPPNESGALIRQAYLTSDDADSTVRVRTSGDEAWITIKGRNVGASREEWEFPIPLKHALEMIQVLAQGPTIEKTRYKILHGGLVWELDVFHGANDGLVVVEVEAPHGVSNPEHWEPEHKPSWAHDDVTCVSRYFNSRLVQNPYRDWPSRHRTRPDGTVEEAIKDVPGCR